MRCRQSRIEFGSINIEYHKELRSVVKWCQSLIWLTHGDIYIDGTAAGLGCRGHQGDRQKIASAVKYITHLVHGEYFDLTGFAFKTTLAELK